MTIEERIEERLGKIENLLVSLIEREQVREWYSVEQFAQLVGRAEFTVREWCRHGRIKAQKKGSGRGAYPSWAISHAELQRFQRDGPPAREVAVGAACAILARSRPIGLVVWPTARLGQFPARIAIAFPCVPGSQ